MAKRKDDIEEMISKKIDKIIASQKIQNRAPVVRKPGAKINEPAFKQQHNRTMFLNTLAAEVNSIVRIYAKQFKTRDFYWRIQKRFRRERQNKRILLLHELKGLQVNPKHSLNFPESNSIEVATSKDSISVNLSIHYRPPAGKQGNCYCNEVILVTWRRPAQPAQHSSQLSDWIQFTDGQKVFEFTFAKSAGTINWLVCLAQYRGVNEVEIKNNLATAIQLIDAGSFNNKEALLLSKKSDVQQPVITATRPVARPRVKAKESE